MDFLTSALPDESRLSPASALTPLGTVPAPFPAGPDVLVGFFVDSFDFTVSFAGVSVPAMLE